MGSESAEAPLPTAPAGTCRHPLSRHRLALPEGVLDGSRRLVSVAAPAGYGKTTTLLTWRRQLQEAGWHCAWMSLGKEHRDPIRFLHHLLAALRAVAPDIGQQAERTLRSVGSYAVEPALAALLDDSTAAPDALAIIIDDVHEISDSPSARVMGMLLDRGLDRFTVVLAGRESPQYPLAKVRVAGRLHAISAEDLQFTTAEAAALLRDSYGLDLAADVVDEVVARTEGWPAAIQFCALGFADHGRDGDFVHHIAGAQHEVAAYLAETVFVMLPPELQTFMMKTAVLDHIHLDLARSVSGRDDAAEWIELIERKNLFLEAVDDRRETFRYHALFAEFLRRRLRQKYPAAWGAALRVASKWCWDHEREREAIEYAMRGENWSVAATLVAAMAEEMARHRGEHVTLLDWLSRIPEPERLKHPALLLHQAWALNFNRRRGEAQAVLEQLARQVSLLAPDQRRDIERGMELQRLIEAALYDEGAASARLGGEWIARWPDAPPYDRGAAYAALGFGLRTVSESDEAMAAAECAQQAFDACAGHYGRAWADLVRVTILVKRGQFTDAWRSATDRLAASDRELGEDAPPSCMLAATLAFIEYERGKLKEAGEALSRGLQFVEQQGSVDSLIWGYGTMARLALADGDAELAFSTLREGEQFGMDRQLPRLTCSLAAERAIIHLRRAEIDAAEEVIKVRNLFSDSDDAVAPARREKAAWLQAQLDFARGHLQPAQKRLRTLAKHMESTGQRRKWVEMELLRAIVMRSSGEQMEAARLLKRIFVTAAEETLVRFIVDYGEWAHGVIADHLAARSGAWAEGMRQSAEDQLLLRVARELRVEEGALSSSDEALAEPLSKRELEILRRANSGLSNRNLAEALFLSESTLKWHLHNIYTKLHVRNRTGAIAKARRLSLLS